MYRNERRRIASCAAVAGRPRHAHRRHAVAIVQFTAVRSPAVVARVLTEFGRSGQCVCRGVNTNGCEPSSWRCSGAVWLEQSMPDHP